MRERERERDLFTHLCIFFGENFKGLKAVTQIFEDDGWDGVESSDITVRCVVDYSKQRSALRRGNHEERTNHSKERHVSTESTVKVHRHVMCQHEEDEDDRELENRTKHWYSGTKHQ